jgi:hypothetical protein
MPQKHQDDAAERNQSSAKTSGESGKMAGKGNQEKNDHSAKNPEGHQKKGADQSDKSNRKFGHQPGNMSEHAMDETESNGEKKMKDRDSKVKHQS